MAKWLKITLVVIALLGLVLGPAALVFARAPRLGLPVLTWRKVTFVDCPHARLTVSYSYSVNGPWRNHCYE